MSEICTIANQKGGVGKSTTCACLSAALAEIGKRILAVDLDPQGGLTTSLGFDPDSFQNTAYNVLINSNESPVRTAIIETEIPNLFLLPSNLDLAGAEGELIGEIGWDKTLKDALFPIAQDYDSIFIDCPPSLGILTTNGLMAAQTVIIPVQSEYLALKGLKELNRVISKIRKKGNPDLKIRILRTMHDARSSHTKEVIEELEKIFGDQVYQSVIKRTIKFADSALAGKPIILYAKSSEGAEAYRQLTQEVLKDEQ